MSKYRAQIEWSGYSRGYMTVEVEAESPEEALELVHSYEWDTEVDRGVVRDDTEKHTDDVSIDEIEEVK